jgi:hypothetical protein
VTLKQYKFLGIMGYYGFMLLFYLADIYYQTGGDLLIVGRCYAIFSIVIFFVLSTGEESLAAITAELNGPPPVTLADSMWKAAERTFFWGAFAFCAYFAYEERWWDAVCALGYPLWHAWLRLEMRRVNIHAGRLKPDIMWPVAMWISLASAVFGLFAMMLLGYGPYRDLGWGPVQIYPLFLSGGLTCFIVAFVGNGSKIP